MKAVFGKHLCKVLERKGWTLASKAATISTTAERIAYRVSSGPRNTTLPTGTQHGIMKAAGLTEADL